MTTFEFHKYIETCSADGTLISDTLGFTSASTASSYQSVARLFSATTTGIEKIDQAELRKRLLLYLFGLEINIGLASMSMGEHGFSYANLQQHAIWRGSRERKRGTIFSQWLTRF